MAAIVVPLILWVFMWLFEENGGLKKGRRAAYAPWTLLFLINIFAGVCTSIGVLLAGGLIALLAVVLSFYVKNWKLLIPAVLTCVPNMVYVLLYLYLK